MRKHRRGKSYCYLSKQMVIYRHVQNSLQCKYDTQLNINTNLNFMEELTLQFTKVMMHQKSRKKVLAILKTQLIVTGSYGFKKGKEKASKKKKNCGFSRKNSWLYRSNWHLIIITHEAIILTDKPFPAEVTKHIF